MGNPVSAITFGIPVVSYDGIYWSRWPSGKPQASGSGSTATASATNGSATGGAVAIGAGVSDNASAAAGSGAGAAAASGAGVTATAAASSGFAQAGTPTDITTMSVEGSGTQWVSFGQPFVLGDVPTSSSLVVTDTSNNVLSTSQVDVLSTHEDGSVAHATIHAQLTGGTSYKIRTGTSPTGTTKDVAALLAAVSGDICRVDLTSGVSGSAVLRDLLSSATNRAAGGLKIVEQGPNTLGVVVAQDLGTHVRINFHIRWYGSTTYWVEVYAENSYGNVASQGDKSYTVAIAVAGSTVLSATAVTHWNHTAWQREYWSTGGSLYVKPAVGYLLETGAFPYYDTTSVAAPTSTQLNNLVNSTPGIGSVGSYGLPTDLNGSGGAPHIGLLPSPDARYFASSCDKRAFDHMRGYHQAAMVYSTVQLNSADGEHMSVWDFSTYRKNTVGSTWTNFASGANSTSNTYATSLGYEQSTHGITGGYTMYMLTGKHSSMRQMIGWAAEHAMFPGAGNNFSYDDGAGSKTYRLPTDTQLRNVAWCQRMWMLAGYALPDSHPQKRYFRGQFLATSYSFYQRYVAPASDTFANSIGVCPDGDWRGSGGSGSAASYPLFMHNFLVAVNAWAALDLGYSQSHVLDFAKFVGKFTAGLLGNTSEYPFEMSTGSSGNTGRISIGVGGSSVLSTMTAVAAHASNTSSGATSLVSGTTAMAAAAEAADPNHTGARNEIFGQASDLYNQPDGYFANMQPAASYLERLGIPGGWECWYRTQLSGKHPDYRDYNNWAVLPRPIPLPTWAASLPLLRWHLIPSSSLSGVGSGATVFGDPINRINAWSGAALSTWQSEYYLLANGGHNDFSGNEVLRFRLRSESPSWSRVRDASSTQQVLSKYYSDGRPSSRHSGSRNHALDGQNKIVLFGAYATYGITGANTYAGIDTFDITLGDYRTQSINTTGAFSDGPSDLSNSQQPPIAYSRASGCLYWINDGATGTLRVWRPVGAGSMASIGSTGAFESIYKTAALDPVRGRMLVTRGFDGESYYRISIDDASKTNVSPGSSVQQTSSSLEWDPHGGRFLFYGKSVPGEIYSIDPVTFSASALGMTTGADGAPSFHGSDAGVFNRMRYVPEMKGIVVMAAHNQGVWFARIN